MSYSEGLGSAYQRWYRAGSSIGDVTAETITPNDEDVAQCDNYGGVSSRPLPDDDYQRQLDHIDTMLHEIKRMLDQLEPLIPLIPRALALLDPGRAMRKKWGKDAVQKPAPAPLPVGEAPPDSPPMGT